MEGERPRLYIRWITQSNACNVAKACNQTYYVVWVRNFQVCDSCEVTYHGCWMLLRGKIATANALPCIAAASNICKAETRWSLSPL